MWSFHVQSVGEIEFNHFNSLGKVIVGGISTEALKKIMFPGTICARTLRIISKIRKHLLLNIGMLQMICNRRSNSHCVFAYRYIRPNIMDTLLLTRTSLPFQLR